MRVGLGSRLRRLPSPSGIEPVAVSEMRMVRHGKSRGTPRQRERRRPSSRRHWCVAQPPRDCSGSVEGEGAWLFRITVCCRFGFPLADDGGRSSSAEGGRSARRKGSRDPGFGMQTEAVASERLGFGDRGEPPGHAVSDAGLTTKHRQGDDRPLLSPTAQAVIPPGGGPGVAGDGRRGRPPRRRSCAAWGDAHPGPPRPAT